MRGDQTDVPEHLFDTLWSELAVVVGSAATAALLKRAVRASGLSMPVEIERVDLNYVYRVPEGWDGESGTAEFQVLVDRLSVLLRDLTGSIVLDRLVMNPTLSSFVQSAKGAQDGGI